MAGPAAGLHTFDCTSGTQVGVWAADEPSMTLHPAVPFRRAALGVTLIELMVVLVVIAVLASVAAPVYLGSVTKGRRTDAVDAAVGVMQAQERYRAGNTSYGANFSQIGLSDTSAGRYYTLALSGASASGYTLGINAVSGSAQAADGACTSLSVTVSLGNPVFAPQACWSR